MKMSCLLVDDEPIARDILKGYIDKTPYLEIAGNCASAMEAFQFLQSKPVDLIFLDIEMPEMTGLQFLKSLTHPPKVILTTAYREFAVEGYELNALDYLVKPISFERFIKAVGKLNPTTVDPIPGRIKRNDKPFIFIKEDRKLIKIYLHEIIYIESQRDYVKIQTDSREIKTRHTLTYFVELLPDSEFIKIHRSFLVAFSRIRSIGDNKIEVEGKELPIGGNYKEQIMSKFNIQ